MDSYVIYLLILLHFHCIETLHIKWTGDTRGVVDLLLN